MNKCEFKYTCTAWYVYIVLVVLMLGSTLLASLILYSQKSTMANVGAIGTASGCISTCVSFLICIGLLSLLCPTQPGRIIIWIVVICSICSLISNIIGLIAMFKGVNMVNGLANNLSSFNSSNSNNNDVMNDEMLVIS